MPYVLARDARCYADYALPRLIRTYVGGFYKVPWEMENGGWKMEIVT